MSGPCITCRYSEPAITSRDVYWCDHYKFVIQSRYWLREDANCKNWVSRDRRHVLGPIPRTLDLPPLPEPPLR